MKNKKINYRNGFCVKKKAYNSEFECKTAGAMAEILHNTKLRYYQCPNCQKWHLTHREANGILSETL